MSGHSKWKKIKRQKGAADIKKGNVFTRLAQMITIAVREGGSGDPDMNFMLRLAIEKAKSENMPKDNIERAINKGLGKGEKGTQLESITYEIIGSNGIALLVDCLTDNKNRTVSEIRNIISKRGFHIGSGSLMWQFDVLGRITLSPYKIIETKRKGRVESILEKVDKEKLILLIMDLEGVRDVEETDNKINIITGREDFMKIYNKLNKDRYKIEKGEIVKLPKNKLTIKKESLSKIEEMISEIDELEDTATIWSNINRQETN